jgi:TolA-binding protein
MKDPQPLLDNGATELELRLLQAGDADRPSAKARQAALAALGLSGAVLSASSSAAATAGSTALSSGARVLAAKWWAVGALVTAGGVSVGYATLTSSPAGTPSAVVVPRLSPPPMVATAAPLPEPEVSASASPALTTSRERPTSSPPRSSSSAGSLGIQEQIVLVDRARAAVAAQQPATALAALDEYQRRFPGGVLAQEATLLRIDALLARGDKASAARLGRQFLQRYPRSPMAARVKTLIDG